MILNDSVLDDLLQVSRFLLFLHSRVDFIERDHRAEDGEGCEEDVNEDVDGHHIVGATSERILSIIKLNETQIAFRLIL
jgi:hypothetical protein